MKVVYDVATLRRNIRPAIKSLGALATSVVLVAGFALISASPAAAAGSTPNAISVGAAPSAGGKGGSYLPSASASSGDKVSISIASGSTGCTLVSGRVDFTGAGVCVVSFNDPGNSSYAAAPLVQRSTTVYSANKISVSTPPAAGSTGGSYSPGASVTSGDAVVRSLASTSTGCSLASFKVTFTGSGRCRVVFSDAGNGAFAAATAVHQTITVYSANVIHASTAPANGTIDGSYTVSATATSGDKVAHSLDGSSTGCSMSGSVVTFASNGVCLVNFNDAGNGAFAKANQVQQSITVGSGNPNAQAAIVLTSIRGRHGHPLTLTSSGGSGSGAVTYAVSEVGTAGCWTGAGLLHSARAGTCLATVTKSADATYASAESTATKVTFLAMIPKAARTTVAVWTGRTVTTTITGSGFYGAPLIVSNAGGTRVAVLRDTGHSLVIRVSVAADVARGVHTFTIVFAHGQITRIHYLQR